ncbi:MAG: UPF0280 family protein [Candidatus Hadarchaeales archaeon]
MHFQSWTYRETRLNIKCDEERAIDAAIHAGILARAEVERYVGLHPEFRWSLEPIDLPGRHPRVIELMLRAGKTAGVGPFAAVAGAIAQVAAEAAIEAGARNVIVENGGDIAIMGNRDFRIAVFPGPSMDEKRIPLGFHINAGDLPMGICTSSGTVGHSISFGDADAVVVFAREAATADGAATSIANEVKGSSREGLERGLQKAGAIGGILGCLIIYGGDVGKWGSVPELVEVSPSSQELTRRWHEYSTSYLGAGPFITRR